MMHLACASLKPNADERSWHAQERLTIVAEKSRTACLVEAIGLTMHLAIAQYISCAALQRSPKPYLLRLR
jgi:hypothetical protein